ncbi:MAG: DUF3592 domain-containing protein [Actinobacteria bacterium]|nr:MAG: DUF3592 domain-containing protein [Actinomycetota bacterium]
MIAIFKNFNLVGKIGLIVGLLGGLVGMTVAIITDPLFGIIFSVIVIAVIYFSCRVAFGSIIRREALMKNGVQAEATIVDVDDTGMTVNEIYPVIRFTLEVRPPEGEPFRAESKELINRMDIPTFQPGAIVPVLYDPRNPKNIVFGTKESLQDARGMAPAAAEGTVDPEKIRMAQEFLEKEEKEHDEIRASGKPARARILVATPLGMNVNGNNPAMSFMLEVQPEGEPAFHAQTTGVIAEASVPKYQPGREIFVKYDPADHGRVSLDHS